MTDTFLITGLGNPGRRYEATRHNAGFMVLDLLAQEQGAPFNTWQGGPSLHAKATFGAKIVHLLKPMDYMNLSGNVVSSLSRFYKIPPQNIMVVFDDMSLPAGALRLRQNGSAGGQNGMKHIIEQLGTQDIPRLRLGTGPRPPLFDAKDFVLSKFTAAEQPLIKTALERATQTCAIFIEQGFEKAQLFANTN